MTVLFLLDWKTKLITVPTICVTGCQFTAFVNKEIDLVNSDKMWLTFVGCCNYY